ncbi:MAG: prolyl oligopeptidase family serine peptidase [Beduini sp.]|uniref:prolyl oligopeptidase family serine peptidase n=1 Tax=Beduini sp. TaxID=1922300 RepID=UPI0011C9BE93
MLKKVLSCFVCALMVISSVKPIHAANTTATGNYKIIVDGYDWGPAVSKAVLSLDKPIDSVAIDDLKVTETKNWYPKEDGTKIQDFAREVTGIYLSDENGNKVSSGNSKFVAVEMEVGPDGTGSPFIYAGLNDWTDPYYLTFEFKTGKTWQSGGNTINTLAISQKYTDKNIGLAEKFKNETYNAAVDGNSYAYASYEPAGANLPLIIWLHGGGEGGDDASIVTLGNRVTGLLESKTQNAMGGSAYVLAPQSPTMWMDGYSTTDGGDSIYTEGLMELITWYVNSHPNIDTQKIYIGGCSNGGYMTLQMVTTYPGYFAAAFPICSGYASATMSDEKLALLKDFPLWFTYAQNDTVLNPDIFSKPMIERLKGIGATNLHVFAPADVHDTSGLYFKPDGTTPYQYNGHWSWIYVFNNEATEGSTELFQWLGQQKNTTQTIAASGTQSIVVEGFDWGPAVTKTIVSLDTPINSINASQLKVIESKHAMDWSTMKDGVYSFDRTVTNAYLSDINGNPVNTASAYITIEMAVGPNDGSPFYYDLASGLNSWTQPYDLNITLKDNVRLLSGDKIIDELKITATPASKNLTDAELFTENTFTSGNQSLKYASFAPSADDGQNPLIIWLHGAGEGGTDTTIDTLGNKVTALVGDEIQGIMNGAYVLAPQSLTFWMDDGSGQYTKDGTSQYTEVLMALIENFVDSHPDIDPNRVYIGGCSNGGFMTMNMILKYPTYFAAAFPICEAYDDSWITDEMLEGIKDLPIWFTQAANDTVVDPQKTMLPTYDRLAAMNASNLHRSYFDDVHDTSGLYFMPDGVSPHQYNGHWSWIYTLNNECVENGVTIFEWLASQSKPVIKDGTNVPDTGDKSNLVALGGLAVLSVAAGYLALRKKKEEK